MIPVPVIALGATSAVSIGANVFQGIQNAKLRKQIEKLKAIIQNQQNDIEELKKQMSALKLWAFKERLECSKKIKSIKSSMASNKERLRLLNGSIA